MMRKIGSYTWHKGVCVYDKDLLDYFHSCVDSVLNRSKWWKQEKSQKRIRVTIEVEE